MWYHTEAMGAGRWHNVDPNNYWADDYPGWPLVPRVKPDGSTTLDPDEGAWSEGTMIWYIRCGWGERMANENDVPVMAKEFAEPNNQSFHIDEYGTLTVSKLQHSVSRGTNNVICVDGGQ